MPQVFVSDGSGFLGRNLIRYLTKLGHTVTAIARSQESAKKCHDAGATKVVRVDLFDVQRLAEAAQGCVWCCHTAADVTQWAKDWAPIRLNNVQGTVNVITACKMAGVKRVVHVSSEGVICQRGRPLKMADETVPPVADNGHLGPYQATKKEAEVTALSMNGYGIEVVVVRPRFIWGGDDTILLPSLARAAREGLLKWFNGGLYHTSTVHVDNVVHGILKALENGRPGEVYFLTDGEPIVWKELITDMLLAAGIKEVIYVKDASLGLFWNIARLLEWRSMITGVPPKICRAVLAAIGVECTVSDAKARAEIGYTNVISVHEGIEDLRRRYAGQGKTVLDARSTRSVLDRPMLDSHSNYA